MGNDKKFEYESLPIPSYEEAISSRPSSSRSHLGPDEASDDAERQGLLHNADNTSGPGGPRSRPHGYQPPTVESVRNSLDDLASSGTDSARGSLEELQRELAQMDVEEAGVQSSSRRSRLGQHFSKRFNSLSRTLSAIQFPFRRFLPNFRFTINLDGARPRFQDHSCIIMLRVFGLLLVVALVYVFFFSNLFNLNSRFMMGQSYSAASVQNFLQGHINETNIADNLRKVTKFPHMAGTEGSFALAEWIEQEFKNAGLDEIEMEEFQVYLNYPNEGGRRVAIVDPPGMAWEAALEEKNEQTMVFHGHSKSGNVTGHLVYANYGSREDFQLLADQGIDMKGAIALVRYYGSETDRALKVKLAEMAGAAGCIIYSDPHEDGFRRGPAFPDGRFMPDDGVQRGAVSLMSWVVGDVLSPGFASTPQEKKRLSIEESPGLPGIPSIPIAWRDAQRLLQVLKGHGTKVPKEWVGGVPEVQEWWTGDGGSPKVNLMNILDEVERQPIYNVVGRIIGLEQPEKKVIVGNHRDSWCLGSADPGSGTAVFLELVRVFGELRTFGWRPLRTIEFVSWDAEEYNMIGSTEHVEKAIEALRENAFAYLNVDVGVTGNNFDASGSPLFQRIVMQILGRIADPITNETLKDIWERAQKKFSPLGSGSDYVAFQDIAGTSSVDFGFTGERFPYHSCYENYDWMTKFGDPGFQYHKALGQFWALLLIDLADNPILQFDLQVYADHVHTYVTDLVAYAKSKNVPVAPQLLEDRAVGEASVSFQPLFDAASKFKSDAEEFDQWAQLWHDTVWGAGGFENNVMAIQRLSHNSRLASFDTQLLDLDHDGGVSTLPSHITSVPDTDSFRQIPNRTQFKHVIFGPQLWSGYDAAVFPAIRDSIDSGNWTLTQEWIDRVAKIIHRASNSLVHN
ncbi:glutamate carboxypeptidase Tre2, putative [Aspergillus fumigatus Af293]|uniref:Glutamate carboxypeptidase Tre2, putative n=1 Tax=Aspergillus fumigatus (strain ATCC MYA-4609 / CBS 101355 / FGSC A1100 / Af293) TaxID=330879 RepID=Q4WXT7_ASPFU|nr:glutamate carboxypeptidase Tre2, putative [Aspergillus fumigatus Af293]EAL92516.1 glutamate carboxypeptidase Tre2, putative [Aspergillus fumigatus Af293]